MWKSRRRIQVNPIQDYQILTTAHTLCWALKIPNGSKREERHMNEQGPSVSHREIRSRMDEGRRVLEAQRKGHMGGNWDRHQNTGLTVGTS